MVTTHGHMKFFLYCSINLCRQQWDQKLSRLTWGSFCITPVEKSKYHIYVKKVSGAIIVQGVDCDLFLVTV